MAYLIQSPEIVQKDKYVNDLMTWFPAPMLESMWQI